MADESVILSRAFRVQYTADDMRPNRHPDIELPPIIQTQLDNCYNYFAHTQQQEYPTRIITDPSLEIREFPGLLLEFYITVKLSSSSSCTERMEEEQ